MSPKKDTQKSARSANAINKKSPGFIEEERAALKELTAADEERIGLLVKKAVS